MTNCVLNLQHSHGNKRAATGFHTVAVAQGAGMNKVRIANPCMGSFVGRSATTKHDTDKCGRASTNLWLTPVFK